MIRARNMTLVIDTDPGVDDTLALLLLLSQPKKIHELRAITLTYGNCSLRSALANVLSLFAVIERENNWRAKIGWPPATDQHPSIYIGARGPIGGGNAVDAEEVHGQDGLAGIHSTNPEFDAPSEWFSLFENSVPPNEKLPFKVGNTSAAHALVDILNSEPAKTVTIMAVGPLTNLAEVATIDPGALSRAKNILVMGAALRHSGNITPLAEFNVYADPTAASLVYGLTSPYPSDVMPSGTPEALLKPQATPPLLILFPLDLTERHMLHRSDVNSIIGRQLEKYPDSVLARWVFTWITASFANYGAISGKGPDQASCQLHDPLTAAYAVASDRPGWRIVHDLDIRVETNGRWSLGQTIIDRRGIPKSRNPYYDVQGWLNSDRGCHISVAEESPFEHDFASYLLKSILSIPCHE